MKRKSFIVILCFNLVFLGSQAQVSDEVSLLPLLNDAEYYYKKLEREYHIIEKFEIDLVSESSSRYAPVKLTRGKNYTILAFGERNRIIDLDLKIYAKEDDDWVVVKNLNNPDNLLETTFEPDYTGFYEFEIIGQQYTSGYSVGRYCLMVAYR